MHGPMNVKFVDNFSLKIFIFAAPGTRPTGPEASLAFILSYFPRLQTCQKNLLVWWSTILMMEAVVPYLLPDSTA